MSKVRDFILDIFMPNRCPCCEGFIKWDKLICEKCAEALEPVDNSGEAPPAGCSAAVSAYKYDGAAKQGIYALKDGWGLNFAVCTAPLLAEKLKGCGADLITCVPMAKRKANERGYNQAEVVAGELSKLMDIPCDCGLLTRRPTSLAQHDLATAAERAEFARTLYGIADSHEDITGRKLLLADDVHTTGATLSECAGKLLSMGAAEVIAVTLCRTVKEKD